MEKLRVRKEFLKLKGVTTNQPLTLLYCGIIPPLRDVGSTFDAFYEYDAAIEGGHVEIQRNAEYLILLFKDVNNKLVTISKPMLDGKAVRNFYANVGKEFEFEVV